jgi:hypothetical protein
MSYLSERQCQLCVDRGVASTQRRPLGLQMHIASHQHKPRQVCVCVCVCECARARARASFVIYMLHRRSFHVTYLRTSYVTKTDATFFVVT